MRTSVIRIAVLCAPLLLAACGEGWEAQKTTDYFPYGDKRTAGSGVVYVRTKMMPEKELKVEPVVEVAPPAPVEEPKPALKADKIFTDAQTKGGSALPAVEKTEPVVEGEAKDSSALPEVTEDAVPDKSSSLLRFEHPQAAESEEHASSAAAATAAPTVTAMPQDVQPQAGAEPFDEYKNAVAEPVRAIAMPDAEIVSPKRDFMMLSSEGKRSLSEIYDDTF